MKNLIEIRWHGRAGQGAKTASLLLADIAFSTGKFIQCFPEYGPERMGAPITAFNRIADERIILHSNIYEPNYVIVVEPAFLNTIAVTNGLKKDGAIIINTDKNIDELKKLLNNYSGKIYRINASKIASDAIGSKYPNIPMLSAIVKVTNLLDEQTFYSEMEALLKAKFSKKPEVLLENLKALKIAFNEVEELQ